MTRPAPFRDGDKAHVVEYDPATRRPLPGGKVIPVTVVDLAGGAFTWLFYRVRMPDGGHAVFFRDSRWLRFGALPFRWRLEAIRDGG
jgi:hypothetical protein